MLAVVAGFRRGKEAVNLDQCSSVPLGFILELPDKLAPSHITDCFCKAVVLDHVLDCQTFDANHLVFVNDASRELMLVVSPLVIDTGMHTGYFEPCLVPVLGTLLFLGMPSLCFCQTLLVLGIEFGITDCLTSGHDYHRLETQVKTNHLVYHWQGFDVVLYQHRNEEAVCAIFSDSDRARFASFGQILMEGDIQGNIHFCQRELLPIPLKGIRSIGSRLAVLFLLEVGVFSSSLKEVLECSIQVSEGLLKRDRRHLREPGMLFFQIRQHGSKSIVVEFFALLFVGKRASIESPIVHIAAASECLSKDDSLLVSRIEPIFVRPLVLTHCLFAFLGLYIAFNGLKCDTSNRAHIVGICPQRWDLFLEIWELLPQLVSSSTLNEFDQPMDSKLGIATNHQMDMVWHDFYLNKFLLPLLNTFLDECLQSAIDGRKQDLSPILWAKDNVVVAIIGDIIVASSYCSHAQSIAENSNLVKGKLLVLEGGPCAQAPNKELAYIPMSEGQGFYATNR
jgi:hypothetical protein